MPRRLDHAALRRIWRTFLVSFVAVVANLVVTIIQLASPALWRKRVGWDLSVFSRPAENSRGREAG